jgi:hypothetical protein
VAQSRLNTGSHRYMPKLFLTQKVNNVKTGLSISQLKLIFIIRRYFHFLHKLSVLSLSLLTPTKRRFTAAAHRDHVVPKSYVRPCRSKFISRGQQQATSPQNPPDSPSHTFSPILVARKKTHTRTALPILSLSLSPEAAVGGATAHPAGGAPVAPLLLRPLCG